MESKEFRQRLDVAAEDAGALRRATPRITLLNEPLRREWNASRPRKGEPPKPVRAMPGGSSSAESR
jgi:hypothetical protein